MRQTVQLFATSLLDHVRTSKELEIMLNYDPQECPWQPGERQTLSRLRLAIKSKLKMVRVMCIIPVIQTPNKFARTAKKHDLPDFYNP